MRARSTTLPGAIAAGMALVSLTTAACGSSSTEGSPTGPTPVTPPTQAVAAVMVTGNERVLAGRNVLLTAAAHGADGQRLSANASDFVWSSSNAAVASVSPTGMVTGNGGGIAEITATYRTVTGSMQVTSFPVNVGASRVRAVYMVPRDRPFRAEYSAAIQNALAEVQHFYFEQLGTGRTFSIHAPEPDVCQMTANSDFYPNGTYAKVLSDAQRCLPVRANTPTTVWALYADVKDACNDRGRLGVGSPGLTILGRDDLDGLVGSQVISSCGTDVSLPVNRWIGGLGHELGHTFGLPHPPGCDQGSANCDARALMWSGYSSFPRTYLRDDEKSVLAGSPFFR